MNKTKVEDIIKRFREMRLPVMAETLLNIIEEGKQSELSIVDILDLLTSEEYISRKKTRLID